jgi:hypothetical protein
MPGSSRWGTLEAGTQFVLGTRAYSAHNRLHVNARTQCRFAQSYIGSTRFGRSPLRRTATKILSSRLHLQPPEIRSSPSCAHIPAPGLLRSTTSFARWNRASSWRQILDVAEAQGEPDIKPDRLLDDLGRKAVAAIADLGHHRWLRLNVTDGKPNGDVTMPSIGFI